MVLNLTEESYLKNPNDYFDNVAFREENQSLLIRSDSYVILQGRGFDTSVLENTGIAVEEVESIAKLEDTDLHNIPLLIYNIFRILYKFSYKNFLHATQYNILNFSVLTFRILYLLSKKESGNISVPLSCITLFVS